MSEVALIVTVIFFLLSLIHFYWASGGKIGIEKVIPEIDGNPAMTPGAIITIIVAIGLLGIALISYLLGHYELKQYEYGEYIVYSGWALSLILIIRAIGDFKLVGFFKKVNSSEFSTYDTKYYSPFCLVTGVIFSTLSYSQA